MQDTDIEGLLRHEHEQTIVSSIEEGRRETLNDFYSSVEKSMLMDWEKSKKRIFDELGQHQAGAAANGASDSPLNKSFRASRGFAGFSDISRQSAASPILAVSSQAGPEKPMHKRMVKYAEIVTKLNEYRSSNANFAPASAFMDASSSTPNGSDAKALLVGDSWRLLATMVGERNAQDGGYQNQTPKTRDYVKPYILSSTNSTEALQLRELLASNARRFLEEQFTQHMDSRIAARPHEASIGGAPSLPKKILGYLRIKYLRKEGWSLPNMEANDDGPTWATIYYLMRSGHMEQAYKFAASQEQWLNVQEKSFLLFFKAYMDSSDKRLPKTLRDRFVAEYNQRLRYIADSVDPYKMAVYKIIGRCDLSKKVVQGVTLGTEDYIWMQLMLIRESVGADEPAHEKYSFLDLQELLVKFGPAHFNPTGSKPLHYFNVLLLCGQFERAVHYLFQPNDNAIDAVQFAAVLTYYGLLRIPDVSKSSDTDILTLESQGGQEVAHLNFARIIHQYTHLFARSDPSKAVQYLYLLTLNADLPKGVGNKQVQISHEYVRDLVLESREFKSLLGYLDTNGNRIPGALEKNKALLHIGDEKEFAQRITEQAAIRSESEGRIDDAVQIYNLAGEYDTVIRLLVKQVGEAVDNGGSQIGMEGSGSGIALSGESVIKTAQTILAYYERDAQRIQRVSAKNRDTLRVLIGMSDAFEASKKDQLDVAMSKIMQLDLLPLDESDLVSITRRAERIREIDEALARNLPTLMLLTMRILYKSYMQLKESPYGNEARQNVSLIRGRRIS